VEWVATERWHSGTTGEPIASAATPLGATPIDGTGRRPQAAVPRTAIGGCPKSLVPIGVDT